MPKIISPKIIALTFGVLVIVFLAAFYISAWTEPTGAPPTSNASTTINVSANPQIKEGALQVNGFKNIGTTDVSGNKIINLAEPTANADAATKGYVDAKLGGSGGGGGGLDFYQTTGTYDGAHASTACTAGYHMCLMGEQVGRSYNQTLGPGDNLENASWVDTNSNVLSIIGYGMCTPDYRADCGNWTSNTATGYCGGWGPYSYSGRTVSISDTSPSVVGPDVIYYYGYGMCTGLAPVLCCENNSPQLGVELGPYSFFNAVNYCRNQGGNWHLPSAEELANYVGASTSINPLLTSTPISTTAYLTIKLSDGLMGTNYPASYNTSYFRCVR
jgi:hypothetical protein